MFAPGIHTEDETYAGYVTDIVDHLVAAAFELTEEQARMTPCASALSVGGILKHCAYGLDQYATRLTNPPMPTPEEMRGFVAQWQASFALTPEETLAGVVASLLAARDRFLAELAHTGADGPSLAPPAPWFGLQDPVEIRNRHLLGHTLHELARHAGHADIIREQLDGRDSDGLYLASKGLTPPAWEG